MASLETIGRAANAWIRDQLEREALSSLLHVLFLGALLVVIRPMFFAGVADVHYQAPSVVRSMVESDLSQLAAAAQRHRPWVPEILFLVLPTLAFFFTKRRLRWTDWEHGRELRVIVMALLIMLTWSGALFPYNIYLNRGHAFDRLLLIGFTALSWRTPLAVPFATRLIIVMIKEAYTPIAQDDFDFRSIAEIMAVFSVFVWASLKRSFKPKHFLVLALGVWASYYYVAGVAKTNYGPHDSWLLENHLSNLSVGGYVRGWASFIPEPTFVAFIDFIRDYDVVLAYFTMIVEFGALVAFFVHVKLARLWFFLLFVFQFGIFALTGICFWKWMFCNLAFFVWSGRGGEPIFRAMHRHVLVMLLAVASVYYSANRIWYFPQTHVVWYDSRLVEDYSIFAVGESGTSYLVHPSSLAPQEMQFVQGHLCYAADNVRNLSGIYGTIGSYQVMKLLESYDKPEEALKLHARSRICNDPRRRAAFDQFMVTYFRNVNYFGKKHRWLSWIARPTHLWVMPKGNLYDAQERIVRIELWRTIIYHQGGKLHRLERKLTRTLPIPP